MSEWGRGALFGLIIGAFIIGPYVGHWIVNSSLRRRGIDLDKLLRKPTLSYLEMLKSPSERAGQKGEKGK
jgi:hypothetical protein